MPCVSSKYTESELRDLLLAKEIKKVGEIKDPKEWAATMVKINKMVETKEVDASVLGPKLMKAMGLQKGDMISRYFLDTVLLAKKRGSDLQTIKMINSLGLDKAKSISEKVDTVTKALGGRRIHEANQKLVDSILETGIFKHLSKPSEVDPDFKPMSDKEISRLTNIPLIHIARLRQGMMHILSKIDSMQTMIDPNAQAIILTEQFILNPVKDTGGTVDVLIRFSDNTTGTLDYKTISPDEASGKVNWETNEIIDPDWIPNIKKIAIKEQLGDYNNTLETFYGSEGTIVSRGIPIYVRYRGLDKAKRTEGANITENIKYLAMQGVKGLKGTQATLLSHVPVQELVLLKDKHQQDKINRNLTSLSLIINNLEIELKSVDRKSTEYTKLKSTIENYKRSLDELILEQDFNGLFNAFNQMLKDITADGKLVELNNIDDEVINGKPNPNYLGNGELSKKIREIEALKNIIESSPFYIQEIEIYRDSEFFKDYLQDVKNLTFEANRILEMLKSKSTDRILTKPEQAAIEDVGPVGWWSKFFRGIQEQVAIPFRKAASLIATANNQKRLALQEFKRTLDKQLDNLKIAGKRLGKSVIDLQEMLINPDTENLWGEHNAEFYKDFELARRNKDNTWLAGHIRKKKDAQILYEDNLAVYMASNEGHRLSNPESFAHKLEAWKKNNHPDNIKYTDRYWLYYEIKEDLESKYYSEGYKKIKEIPELLEYYNFWTEKMAEFNDMLGFRGKEKLPKNFLPYIRQDLVGVLSQGTFNLSHLSEEMLSMFQVRQDDTGLGDMTEDGLTDPVTWKPKHSIPRYFVNPIKDNKGNIVRGMKLRDLNKSLYTFAEMTYNYHYMKTTVEPNLEALRDVMMEKGMQQISESKRKKKFLNGAWAKIRGEDIDVLDMFDKYITYAVYGIKIQDATKSQAKFVQNLKRIQANIELSFAPLLWTGNFVQVKTNAYLEGRNGYFYNSKQMAETEAEAMGAMGTDAMKIYSSTAKFFEFYSGIRDITKKNMALRVTQKWINWDTAHFGMRKTQQAISNNIGFSILKNHAIVDGKLVRMARAPEGTKSIKDSIRIVDDILVIDGVTDEKGNVTNLELYTQIRNLAVNVISRTTGSLDPENMSLIYMGLLTNSMMGFKSWMPGMLDARFSGLRYNEPTNSMMEGKYTAMFSDMAREDRAFLEWIGNVVLPKMGQLLLNVSTFGAYNFIASGKFKYKVNEDRAKRLFDKYKEEFRHDSKIQEMSFEDFIEFKQGQIRSGSAELSAILALITIVTSLKGDWDDDGEADWKKNMYTRTLFRMLNRSRRELAFFISPNDWENLFRMPVPIMSLVPDTMKALTYALSGVGDIVTGEEPVTPSGRSKFYYLWRRIPGNKLILVFEPDKMSQLREI
jgi:hypothetical protein